MLNALKKLFGIKAQEKAKPAPYKVETPAPVVEQFPFPEIKKPTVKKATTRAPKAEGEKKPAVKAKTARKPKAPKA
jgi:hypothetical protein